MKIYLSSVSPFLLLSCSISFAVFLFSLISRSLSRTCAHCPSLIVCASEQPSLSLFLSRKTTLSISSSLSLSLTVLLSCCLSRNFSLPTSPSLFPLFLNLSCSLSLSLSSCSFSVSLSLCLRLSKKSNMVQVFLAHAHQSYLHSITISVAHDFSF